MRYIRGNKFAVHISLADAVVDWEGLTPEEEAKVELVGEYRLPHLASRPDLHARAEAMLDAVKRRLITGSPVYNHDPSARDEYHSPSPQVGVNADALDRDSVAKWIAATDARLVQEAKDRARAKRPAFGHAPAKPALPTLLTEKEVLEQLKMSATTLKRRRREGTFPQPTHANPNRWPASVVGEFLESQRIHPDPVSPAAQALANQVIQAAQDSSASTFGDDDLI